MGFKLETLTKLIDTKATSDNKFTLMHYVAETIESQVSELKKPLNLGSCHL